MLRFLTIALVATVAVADPIRQPLQTNVTLTEYIQAFTKLYQDSCKEVTNKSEPQVQSDRVLVHVYYADYHKSAAMSNYQQILMSPEFEMDRETKILIHGWLQKDSVQQHTQLAQLYAFRGKKANVLSIDWSAYACLSDYEYTAEHYVQEIASMVTELIQYIQKHVKYPVHVIGFDMGAHIAGVAAKKLSKKIERITALSPAGRYFEKLPASNKLARGDAKYIDVCHTNQGGAGYSNNIGDIDFLPNGGRQQPLAELDAPQPVKDVLSHLASISYYEESVELGYRGFIARRCNSWQDFIHNKCSENTVEIMGEGVSQRYNGVYYLYVNPKARKNQYYSKGIYGLYPYEN